MRSFWRDLLLVTLAQTTMEGISFSCVLVRLKRKEFRSDVDFVTTFNKVNLDAFTEKPTDLVRSGLLINDFVY